MTTNFKDQLMGSIILFLAVFVMPACNTGGNAVAQSGEWRSEYVPANTEVGTYAALIVYSTKTGDFSQMYANEGKWKKNPNVPAPQAGITPGDIRMQYMPQTLNQFAGLCIYSADTGEWKQLYLQNKEWKINTNFPQPNITLPKGDLSFDFIPGTAGGSAGLNVFCERTKQFEMFYLEGNEWKINTLFPTGKQL